MIIYILTTSSFNNRDKERFGVNYFLEKKLQVVILDVQDYTNPELKSIKKGTYKTERNMRVINCSRLDEIKNSIELYGKGIAILFLSDNIQSIKIKKYLKKKQIKMGIVHAGMLPLARNSNNLTKKIINKFNSLGIFSLLFILLNKLYAKLFNIKKYDFLITSNYETSVENYNVQKPITVIETHCLDYDLALKNDTNKCLVNSKYVVFLDQYLMDHPDFIRSGNPLQISREKYFKELNNLFVSIENKFDFKVVIAAHPRANIEKYSDIFKGREIFFGKSELLVKHCEFVLTHYSTAVNFAVIYKKPILFITSDELITTFIHKYINIFSSTLNQSLINMSHENVLDSMINIDEECYRQYKEKYIKKNQQEELSWSIFYNDYIKKFI